MAEIFAVAGNPVLHSKSPLIQNALLKSCMAEGVYTRIAASSAKEALETASRIGMKGFNVTAPFKEDMLSLLDSLSPDAEKIGAVNTVILEKGKWVGHNTDSIGVVDAFVRNGIALEGKRVVVLGAGGAGTAAAFGLMKAGASVVIVNRDGEKARRIAERLGCRGAPLVSLGRELKNADVLVSAVSTHERIVSPGLLRKGLVVMDANYRDSVLSQDAGKAGCTVVGGLEWLLYQALPAFKLFTGKDGDAEVVRKALASEPDRENAAFSRDSVCASQTAGGQTGRTDRSRRLETRNHKSNIALIGFMGTGKSTIGKELAKELKMELLDTDSLIEKQQGMPIKEIFARKGEAAFRKMERELVKSAIATSSGNVFSCGGGIVLDEANRRALSSSSLVIWLWASPETAVERATMQGNRPLLERAKDKQAKAGELLKERIPLYAETCDLIISTDGHAPVKIAERIIHEIDKAF